MSADFVPGVLRLVATAELDESGSMLEDARARAGDGDQDFDWLVRRWQEGALLLAKFITRAYAVAEHGRIVCAVVVNHGVWLERELPPLVERQVSEIAPKDLRELSRRLGEQGVHVGLDELDEMFIHVELDERLRVAWPAATPTCTPVPTQAETDQRARTGPTAHPPARPRLGA